MRFSYIATFLAFTATALSFTIPEGQPNGWYHASIDENGAEVHELLNDTVPALAPRSLRINAELAKRTSWPSGTNVQCSTLNWLGHSDFYDHAWGGFWNQCYGLGSNRITGSYYYYWGTAVAYMCAYTSNPCSVSEWADAVDWINNVCQGSGGGYDQPGWLAIPGWNKAYGYANSVNSFC